MLNMEERPKDEKLVLEGQIAALESASTVLNSDSDTDVRRNMSVG